MSIAVNGTSINVTIFPDKTSQVWKLSECILESKEFNIEWKFENEGEIFHLQQLVSLIRLGRIPCRINLHMPYLPYARQDKRISNNTTFALTTFADIINRLNFNKVSAFDVHSSVAKELLNNFVDVSPYNAICRAGYAISDFETDSYKTLYAYPDEGAFKRYYVDGSFIKGHKVRDQETGFITEYKISGDDPKGKTILIIDDICDGGMTFKLMAEELKKQGADEIHLYVSHGIFSKGIKTLKDSGINRVFTKDGEVFHHKLVGHLVKEI